MSNKVEYVKDTFDEYLSKSDYVSASDLKTFLKSPRSYFHDKNRTDPKPDKRHFAVGSALHEYIMEKDQFDKNFLVSPKFDRRTKEGKEKYEEFQLKAQGKTIIDEQEMTMIEQMSINAKMNRTFMELLEGSHYEISCYTVDEKTGLKVRLRPDILPTTRSTIVDIKSCLDSSPKGFKRDVYSYGYSLSSAYYLDFLGRENYVFAAIEKNAPFQASMYALNDEMTDYGRFQYRMGLDLLKWSLDNNYYCDYVEFEILKESYLLGDLSNVIETIENSELINILQ
jgi:hypothetical protein